MTNLAVPNGSAGTLERFGATAHLSDELTKNYQEHGIRAAKLVVATLTESPYAPTIDGQTFDIPVTNTYTGRGADEAEGEDTVITARTALREYLNADVPGTKKIKLRSLDAGYSQLLDDVLPRRRTPRPFRSAFEEAMVDTLRSKYNLPVTSPAQALEIVNRAPRKLSVLRLDALRSDSGRQDYTLDAVTEQGRIVSARIFNKSYDGHLIMGMPEKITNRGGRAPGSTIVRTIKERVTELRTAHTR